MNAGSIKTPCGVLELVQGDITLQQVDAIANAANEGLRGGGGVDGAIHRAGGTAIMQECRKIGRCPTGTAVITTAGELQARYVIHTVGPVWRGGDNGEPQLLAGCYRNSLALACEYNLRSIAFPSISTGIYGYPVELAAKVALGGCLEYLQSGNTLDTVRFVLFDHNTFKAYSKAMESFR